MAKSYGWKNYDCLHNCNSGVMIQSWLRILVAFTSLQSKGQKQMPVSLLKDKQTNTYFNLKRQTNECLFQSQETNKKCHFKRCFLKNYPLSKSIMALMNQYWIYSSIIDHILRRATRTHKVVPDTFQTTFLNNKTICESWS